MLTQNIIITPNQAMFLLFSLFYPPKTKLKKPNSSLILTNNLLHHTNYQKQKTNTIMPKTGIFALLKCIKTCQDHTIPKRNSRFGTRIWNSSDRLVELQIRVGPLLKKVHILKPGSSKRLKSKSIYRAYMPQGYDKYDDDGLVKRCNVYYYDETYLPYVWIHDTGGGFSRVQVKQQYVSLDDLRKCSEIRVFRDHQRGCISVRKKFKTDTLYDYM